MRYKFEGTCFNCGHTEIAHGTIAKPINSICSKCSCRVILIPRYEH